MTSPAKARASRQAAERRGRLAEWAAGAWLMAKGYRLLAHRARTPFGEVDLAAVKRGVLVIVEVKARRDARSALEAVTDRQKRRLAHAAVMLSQRWRLARLRIRFDIVVIRPGRWPLHVRDAWRADPD